MRNNNFIVTFALAIKPKAIYLNNVTQMKYNELYKKLRKAGCFLLQHGKRHDRWRNSHNGKETMVPRHGTQEVPEGTLKTIYQELGL